MTSRKPDLKADIKRLAPYAAAAGALLAAICHSLPPHWRAPCQLVAHICSLGGS